MYLVNWSTCTIIQGDLLYVYCLKDYILEINQIKMSNRLIKFKLSNYEANTNYFFENFL